MLNPLFSGTSQKLTDLKIKLIILCAGISFICGSCGGPFITMTSYRNKPGQRYYKTCGYMVGCICYNRPTDTPGQILVTVYTPKVWGKMYDDYLGGLPCDKQLTVLSVAAKFPGTTDTLTLLRKDSSDAFYFTGKNLREQIHKNKLIEISIRFQDAGENRTLIFTRHRYTYQTGGKGWGGC